MTCPFYDNDWCEYALDDEELSCQPEMCWCSSNGETKQCQFGFALVLEEEARVSEETQ